jgi:ribosomal protein S18 acetylase RimI-like enzyme
LTVRRVAAVSLAFADVGEPCDNECMASPPHVRPAIPADLPALGRLGALLVAGHHEFDRRRFLAPMPHLPDAYAQFLGTQLQRENAVILVAERDGAVIGYALGALEGTDYMALRGPAAVLNDLVVDPEQRRQGVGAMLLDAALAALAGLGAPRVVLFTAERNAAAQRLFERSGFRRTMIEMTRELTGAP